jgi:hypothetical protein
MRGASPYIGRGDTPDGHGIRCPPWLDPDTPFCLWYGVSCTSEAVAALSLQDNNLHGELPVHLLDDLGDEISFHLKSNRISGGLDYLPTRPTLIDVSFNRLDGPLPVLIASESAPIYLKYLYLSGNHFAGGVPVEWQALALRNLFLADNALDDGHINAFDAMYRDGNSRLDLTGNQFSGELGNEIISSNLMRRDSSNFSGGLGLCFNAFTISDADVLAWVDDRHFGGIDPERCLQDARQALDASVSGSWYDPLRTFWRRVYAIHADGKWLAAGLPVFLRYRRPPTVAVRGRPGHRQRVAYRVGCWRRAGSSARGLSTFRAFPCYGRVSQMRLDRTDSDQLSYLRQRTTTWLGCGPFENPIFVGYPCLAPTITDRLTYQRLTELAGTRCDNQSPYQAYSGVWYTPERNGEGFVIEALPDDRAVVYWFTYTADGSGQQAWMTGDGLFGYGDIIIDPPPPTIPLTIETC